MAQSCRESLWGNARKRRLSACSLLLSINPFIEGRTRDFAFPDIGRAMGKTLKQILAGRSKGPRARAEAKVRRMKAHDGKKEQEGPPWLRKTTRRSLRLTPTGRHRVGRRGRGSTKRGPAKALKPMRTVRIRFKFKPGKCNLV
jgi:hypothetical protein